MFTCKTEEVACSNEMRREGASIGLLIIYFHSEHFIYLSTTLEPVRFIIFHWIGAGSSSAVPVSSGIYGHQLSWDLITRGRLSARAPSWCPQQKFVGPSTRYRQTEAPTGDVRDF
ncbi:hypothetical protein FKM82_019327 [Ascaphus truei]